MPSLRLALAILVVGNVILAFLAFHEYGSLLDYCASSPEVQAGGDSLSCLEPQHWFWVSFELLSLLLVECGLVVVVGAAWHKQRRPKPKMQ